MRGPDHMPTRAVFNALGPFHARLLGSGPERPGALREPFGRSRTLGGSPDGAMRAPHGAMRAPDGPCTLREAPQSVHEAPQMGTTRPK
eukprot:2936855-Pyramimonas_sp.AAC.1